MRTLPTCMLICIWVILVFCPATQAGETWKIGHVRPADSAVDVDLRKFAEAVQRNSEDAIRLSIHPGSKLGDYSVVQERVAFGEVEMFLGPLGTTVDKRVALALTPYLVDTWSQAEKVYTIGSPLWKQIESYLADQNLKLIGGWPVYFGGIGLTEKVSNPADPDVKKDTIIRVPPIRSFEVTARELGFTPYPITWQYAMMGLKTGMVGGLIGGGAEGYGRMAETIRYYLPVKDHFEYWFLYINLDLWNSLSDKNRQVLSQAAGDMERERYRVAAAAEAASLTELKERGVEIIEVSDEHSMRMREKVRATAWPLIEVDVGEPFNAILRFVESTR